MKKFNVNDIVLEITRRCNLECQHCLRGESENINMSFGVASNFLRRVSAINMITFSGGEPSLNPDLILSILNICSKFKIPVGGFYIATNGVECSNKFLEAIIQWYNYCEDKDICSVQISNSFFHKESIDRLGTTGTKLLRILKIVSDRYDKHKNGYNFPGWFSEGRAKENSIGQERVNDFNLIAIEDNNIEDTLYLNTKGILFGCCDLSYESQEIPFLQIGNVTDINMDLENSIKLYNRRIMDISENKGNINMNDLQDKLELIAG